MNDLQLILTTAFWICLAALPLAVVALTFLHAAKTPQWVWAFSERTQVVWLALLLLGIGLLPLGLGGTVWYWWKIRPQLASIERGDMGWADEAADGRR